MEKNKEEKNTLSEGYLPEGVEDKTNDVSESREYYALPAKSVSMIWSVISLVLAILSVLLCPLYYVGIILAVAAVVFAVVSSRKLGFFDKMSIFGLIIGIFGVIFGVFICVLDLTGLAAMMFNFVK